MSRERLENLVCIDKCAEKNGTYEMPGRCSNCYREYVLVIPKGHPAPGSFSGWRCVNCGCSRVGADHRPPAEPLPAPAVDEALAELQIAVSRPVGVAMDLEETEHAQRAYLALEAALRGRTEAQAVVEAAREAVRLHLDALAIQIETARVEGRDHPGVRVAMIDAATESIACVRAALARSTPAPRGDA